MLNRTKEVGVCGVLAATCVLAFAGHAGAGTDERVLESPRFLGRGNTFVAAPDSDEALRGNPATLGEETKLKWQVRWLQFDAMLGENSVDTLSDLTSVDGSETAVTLLQKFEDKFGKRQYARLQLSPMSLRILQFEISPFVANHSFVDMRLPTTPEIEILSDSMFGLNVGLGFQLTKEIVGGVTLRPAQRVYLAGSLAFADVVDFLPPTSREISDVLPVKNGTSIGADLGVTWRPAKSWRFGALIENAGYTSDMNGGKDAPPPIPQRISLGTQYRHDFKPWNLDLYADLQDLANAGAKNPTRLLHLGSEFGRQMFTRDHDVGVVAGINDGYFACGAFADLWLVRFDVVNYAVELGEIPGDRMDRRWGATARVTTSW